MSTMNLLESDAVKLKLSRLNPELQGIFMKYLREMYDQESDMMIGFLNESRKQLQDESADAKAEQEALKETQKSLDDVSQAGSPPTGRRHSSLSQHSIKSGKFRKSNATSPAPGELHNKLAVERYMKKRERTASAFSARASPIVPGTPESGASFEEESQEILHGMTHANARIENERDRQAELVKRMKEKRRAEKQAQEAMATEILEQAGEGEMARKKDKERQEQKLKEKLEKKKKKKAEGGASLETEKSDHDNEHGDDDKKQKKKKKKKKEKDETDEENESEKDKSPHDDDDDKKEKKKKKKKKKEKENDEEDANVDDDDDNDHHEKKKKKKKKKDKEKDAEEA